MIQVLNEEQTKIIYDKNKSLFLIERIVPKVCNNDFFKAQIKLWATTYSKYKPVKQLINMTQNFYVSSNEMQKWIDAYLLNEALKNGLKEVAIVVNSDLFVRLSHEVIMEENNGRKFNLQYFEDVKTALDWLNTQ